MKKQNVLVLVLTPHLTECLDEELEKTQIKYGYERNNFHSISKLETKSYTVHLIKPPDTQELARKTLNNNEMTKDIAKTIDLVIAGATRPGQEEVKVLKDDKTGLIIARYSTFYPNKNGYTNMTLEEAGYALDIPKKVCVVKTLLRNDKFLKAITKRDEAKIIDAITGFNKGSGYEPVLISGFLTEALKIQR